MSTPSFLDFFPYVDIVYVSNKFHCLICLKLLLFGKILEYFQGSWNIRKMYFFFL